MNSRNSNNSSGNLERLNSNGSGGGGSNRNGNNRGNNRGGGGRNDNRNDNDGDGGAFSRQRSQGPSVYTSKFVKEIDPTDPEVIVRKSNFILNKLSVTNFPKLSDEFLALLQTDCNASEEFLKRAVDCIVTKAQMEENFCFIYADLCRKIIDSWTAMEPDTSTFSTTDPDEEQTPAAPTPTGTTAPAITGSDGESGAGSGEAGDGTVAATTAATPAAATAGDEASNTAPAPAPAPTSATRELRTLGQIFRELLLSRCQTEFEFDAVAALEAIRSDATLAADEKVEKEILLKKRSTGHMRFIGELYVKELIPANVMKTFCLDKLVDSQQEEELVCLCKLLQTIGARIEKYFLDKARLKKNKGKNMQNIMPDYFEKISQLAQSHAISRVRFMLKDLIDMRNDGWTARREAEKMVNLNDKSGGGGGGGGGAAVLSVLETTGATPSSSSAPSPSIPEEAVDEWSVVPERSRKGKAQPTVSTGGGSISRSVSYSGGGATGGGGPTAGGALSRTHSTSGTALNTMDRRSRNNNNNNNNDRGGSGGMRRDKSSKDVAGNSSGSNRSGGSSNGRNRSGNNSPMPDSGGAGGFSNPVSRTSTPALNSSSGGGGGVEGKDKATVDSTTTTTTTTTSTPAGATSTSASASASAAEYKQALKDGDFNRMRSSVKEYLADASLIDEPCLTLQELHLDPSMPQLTVALIKDLFALAVDSSQQSVCIAVATLILKLAGVEDNSDNSSSSSSVPAAVLVTGGQILDAVYDFLGGIDELIIDVPKAGSLFASILGHIMLKSRKLNDNDNSNSNSKINLSLSLFASVPEENDFSFSTRSGEIIAMILGYVAAVAEADGGGVAVAEALFTSSLPELGGFSKYVNPPPRETHEQVIAALADKYKLPFLTASASVSSATAAAASSVEAGDAEVVDDWSVVPERSKKAK